MSDSPQTEPFRVEELSEEDKRLVEQYLKTGVTVDNLAYSDEFERLYEALSQAGDHRSKRELFRRLLSLRKAGWLPRVA